MNLENTSVQMRKGILEFCVMHVIARGEVYTSDLIQELTAARMVVVEGTLFPLLTRLKNAGLLQYAWKESNSGPPRKYYSLTEQGTENLAALSDTWQEILTSVSTLLQKPVSTTETETETETETVPAESEPTSESILPDPESPEKPSTEASTQEQPL
jgi:PadR family transcriptional regulator PadR